MICRWLPGGKLTLVNEAYCRYFGKKREELIGSSIMPFIKGYTDVLLDMEQDEQKLQAINRNNEKLIDLIERASTFAKLESMEEIEFIEMDIGSISKEVVDNFRLPLEEKQMIVEFVADGTTLPE